MKRILHGCAYGLESVTTETFASFGTVIGKELVPSSGQYPPGVFGEDHIRNACLVGQVFSDRCQSVAIIRQGKL